MLVEDFFKNNYFIMLFVYYLFLDYYKKVFILVELIKFVKNWGMFVVDFNFVREFLVEKGIIFSGNGVFDGLVFFGISVFEFFVKFNGEVVLEFEFDEFGVIEFFFQEGVEDGVEFIVELSVVFVEDVVVVGESFLVFEGFLLEDEINIELELLFFMDDGVEVVQFFEGDEIFIFIGNVLGFVDYGGFDFELEVLEEVFFGGESFIFIGIFEDEVFLEEFFEGEFFDENGFFDEFFLVENGSENGYGDFEEYYENGDNGVKLKIVYGDYGVLIVYVVDEILEEEKVYLMYFDLVIVLKEGFYYRVKEIFDEWELVFDVKNVKFEVFKVKNVQSKEGEVIIQVYFSYFKFRFKKMWRIFCENFEIGMIVDIVKLSYV